MSQLEFHYWKKGWEFTKNMVGHISNLTSWMRYTISFNFKCLSIKKIGKMIFLLWKKKFWTHCNVVFLDKYLQLEKIEYLIDYAKFKIWPFGNSAHSTIINRKSQTLRWIILFVFLYFWGFFLPSKLTFSKDIQ